MGHGYTHSQKGRERRIELEKGSFRSAAEWVCSSLWGGWSFFPGPRPTFVFIPTSLQWMIFPGCETEIQLFSEICIILRIRVKIGFFPLKAEGQWVFSRFFIRNVQIGGRKQAISIIVHIVCLHHERAVWILMRGTFPQFTQTVSFLRNNKMWGNEGTTIRIRGQ